MKLKKVYMWAAACAVIVVYVIYAYTSQSKSAAAIGIPATIKEGSTYLLDFESGTLQSGIYNDGSSNAMKFSGDTAHVSLSGGQLVAGPFDTSTVGVFDYGFGSNPVNKFDNFELSFDMTMTHRALNKHTGIQYRKNAWNDGWDTSYRTHFTYDAKMNFFEGLTSIANTDGGKYRNIKDYGAPGLNRDVMPWETFRVKQVVEGTQVRTYINNSATPIVDVLRSTEVGAGFVGVFANNTVGFKMDNLLFNKLKPESSREDFALAGDTQGFFVYISDIHESVNKFNVRYQNVTDGSAAQLLTYTGPKDQYIFVNGLTSGDYKVELYPVFTSNRTSIDTEITMYQSKTIHVGQALQTQLTVSEGGTFYGPTKQIDISVSGANQIRYTLDGSEPTLTHGTLLTGDFGFSDSIMINGTTTLKAIAIMGGEIKAQRMEHYVAGVNPLTLTASTVFNDNQTVQMVSEYADSIVYTLDGTVPLYNAVMDSATNGTIVHSQNATLTLTGTTSLKAIAVRDGVAGEVASAQYTKAVSSTSAIIREGSTYLLNFESGTLQSGTYHDGSSNAMKFAGDTAHVSLSGGQLVAGPLSASTVGVFDYGFGSNPVNKFDDFELSFDMTMTDRALNKQMGIQFRKNAWNDGWDSQFKTHFTYDAKMNYFEGLTSIANTDGGKYRNIKDYGAPGLNRDVMPWETFRVKQVVEGTRIRTYINNSAIPIVDVLRSSEVEAGFVGVFANNTVGFKMDNLLFNKLKPESTRENLGLTGDPEGFKIFIPDINESVTKFHVRYQNLTDGTPAQLLTYTGPRNQYLLVDGLTHDKDYKVELYPVYTSDRTTVDTEISVYKSQTIHIGAVVGAVAEWDFRSNNLLMAEEQDDLYGRPDSPWSNLLGWDVNSGTGIWADHIDKDNVYRDMEGVHLFTTDHVLTASTSNPNFYLDLQVADQPNIPSEYRYLSVEMKVNHTANAAIYFGTDAGADTNRLSESRKVTFRNTASEVPEFQKYIIDMGEHVGWTGNITKLRIDPMTTYPGMKDGIEVIVKKVSMLRKQDLPSEIRLTQFETSPKEIVSPGDTFTINAVLENIGAGVENMEVDLSAPGFLQVTPITGGSITALDSGESAMLTYQVAVTGTGAGAITLTVTGDGIPVTRGMSRVFSIHAGLPASGQPNDVIIGNGDRRFVFPSPAVTGLDGYGFAWMEAKRGGSWSRIAVMPSLGSVQEIVNQDQLFVKELYAPSPSSLTPGKFQLSFQSPDGASWSGSVNLIDRVGGNLEFEHSLQANQARSMAAVIGPTLLLGEVGIPALDTQYKVIRSTTDLQGEYVNEALFPGLEWLDAMNKNNRSSDTDAVMGTGDAYRYVPHPRKVTVPLMALRKGDLLFGIMWDSRQKWDGTNDQPSAFFGLPNRMERGENTVSTKMSLFIPSILNGMNENATFATEIPRFYNHVTANSNNENPVRQPYMLGAGVALTLKSQVFVQQNMEISAVIQNWTQQFGLPQPLNYAHGTMQQESGAIVTSFENLWNPTVGKWMNKIGPPSSPTVTSAFVLPYAVLGKYGDQADQNVAKQRISSAMTAIGSTYSTYGYTLPFYLEGITSKTMESLKSVNVDSAIATAKLVNPLDVTQGVYWDYEAFISRKGFPSSAYIGQLSDVTAGSNAEFLFKMLRFARLTGNTSASTYGIAGMNYMNANFSMPRGSQSWELRNMIPELETAALMVRANVEAYALTGNVNYLDQGKLWANRGLPFIYLWDDGSYGVNKADGLGGSYGSHTFMRYGAIAAFGQSIYRADGKPLPGTWFGRPVQWSGHDYGIALMELYEAMDGANLWTNYLQNGGLDYRKVSEGLSVSGSRQTTAADNPYPTHLYDAASLLKWETSDYLYPNYQGAELLGMLLGERTNPITKKVQIGTKEIRISAPIEFEVVSAQSNAINLQVGFTGPGEYTVFLQGIAAIGQAQLAEVIPGIELTSFAVRSGSGYAEFHLKVTKEGASQANINLTSLVLK
jgi:hypothetical protein